MPDATRLTRAITAAILDARGLLPAVSVRRRPPPKRGQAVRDAG